jgi:hypothetical protein
MGPHIRLHSKWLICAGFILIAMLLFLWIHRGRSGEPHTQVRFPTPPSPKPILANLNTTGQLPLTIAKSPPVRVGQTGRRIPAKEAEKPSSRPGIHSDLAEPSDTPVKSSAVSTTGIDKKPAVEETETSSLKSASRPQTAAVAPTTENGAENSNEFSTASRKTDMHQPEPQQISEPYLDRLIDEAAADEEWETLDQGTGPLAWSGLDFASLTGRVYQSDSNSSGTSTEYGTQFIGRKETIDNGSFELSIDGLMTYDQQDQRSEGGRVLFRQDRLVISNKWQMDNTAGHMRSQTPRSISAGYRFHLPSTLLQGLGSTLYNEKTSLSLNFGDIGSLSGTAARKFNTAQGSLLGVSATHQFNTQWLAGVQFWDTNDSQEYDDHQSVAGVAQFQNQTQIHQLHFLTDSQSNSGVWYDAAVKQERWSHNLGLYYLQPGLLWTDVAINNDQEGLYWRGNRRSFRWQWTLGTELSKDNLENDPLLPGYIWTNSFANGTWRFRRNTLLGAGLSLNTRHADSGTATGDSRRYTLKNFVNQRFPIGMTRLQASLSVQDNPDEDGTQYGLLWDQVWEIPFFDRLNSDIEYLADQHNPDSISMRLAVEKFVTSDLWFSGSAQYIHMLESDSGLGDASNGSLSANWQISPQWKLSLTADYNRGSIETIDSSDIETENQTILLSLSYAQSSPRRLPSIMGANTDNIGHGEINGRVFLDENRNGRYDLNEAVLKNIVVILDGRFQTETDPNGQFDYWPVAAGKHFITIGIEDVPLPWGLEDDRPQAVEVPARGRAVVDFGLIKLNE